MNKFWAILFLLIPIFGCATFIVGPHFNIWLPTDISTDGRIIDHLFYVILWLTGAVFVGTEVVLFWFLWRYNGQRNEEPAKFTHGSHSLEVVWTILPAATLLFIAIYQMNAWALEKMDRPNIPVTAEVMGRQFQWEIRYPGPDGQLHTQDDVKEVNDLHLPVGEEILLIIKSQDVLHSFFLPVVRLKQDVVPGMKQYVWFKCTETGKYDIVCAELCGWGHYKMKGRLTVEPREDFDRWLAEQHVLQTATTDSSSEGE